MRKRIPLLLSIVATWGCGWWSAPEVHLIPDGYRGDVYIVADMPDGEPRHREGSAMVFNIPTNGILVTRDTRSHGWHTAHFYYVNGSGARRPVDLEQQSVGDTAANRADTRPIVWFQRSGFIDSTDLPCKVSYGQYYVGTRAHLLSRDPNADDLRFRSYVKEHRVCP